MKLKDQNVSFELAKEMEELGVPQNSIFGWYQYEGYDPYIEYTDLEQRRSAKRKAYDGFCHEDPALLCSAHTVAELGEMLKGEIKEKIGNAITNPYYIGCGKIDNEHSFYVRYIRHSADDTLCSTHGETEANARAKMVIYLIKAGIIKAEEIGK